MQHCSASANLCHGINIDDNGIETPMEIVGCGNSYLIHGSEKKNRTGL